MREIRFRFKLARKKSAGGAYIISMGKRWKRFRLPIYWRIILFCGYYACPQNESDYIKCINHEIMHAVLYDIIGEVVYDQWDNIVKDRDGCYGGKEYGWKNIMGKYLPGVYCEDE